MPSFGEKLKQEREKRNITLEQISASTKIGTRMLQALEEDKFNQLPGGIFNKGFVRAYSRCVGLDEDQIVADYLQASGDLPRTEPGVRESDAPRATEKGPEKTRDKERTRVRDNAQDRVRDGAQKKTLETLLHLESSAAAPSRQLPWGLFAAVLLLVALALALWTRRHEEHEKRSLHPSNTTPSQSSASAVAPAATPAPERPSASSTISGSPSGVRATSAASKTPQISQQPTAAPAPGEFTVVIRAREDCWISITADGKTLSSELLAAGAERTVRGQKEVVIKAGNAGGVDFQFNGKKVDLQADYGEVRTVTFGPGGMSRNPPPPTPQP